MEIYSKYLKDLLNSIKGNLVLRFKNYNLEIMVVLCLSSITPPQKSPSHSKSLQRNHIKNMHRSLQKSIRQDLQYIEDNCNNDDNIDIECIIRWDRISSVSKSTKDLLKKYICLKE